MTHLTILALAAVFGLLIHFARRTGKPGAAVEQSALGSRLLLLVAGLVFGVAGALFFLVTVKDPPKYLYAGFVIGPMLCLAGLFACVVALFFPADNVRSMLAHYSRIDRGP